MRSGSGSFLFTLVAVEHSYLGNLRLAHGEGVFGGGQGGLVGETGATPRLRKTTY